MDRIIGTPDIFLYCRTLALNFSLAKLHLIKFLSSSFYCQFTSLVHSLISCTDFYLLHIYFGLSRRSGHLYFPYMFIDLRCSCLTCCLYVTSSCICSSKSHNLLLPFSNVSCSQITALGLPNSCLD